MFKVEPKKKYRLRNGELGTEYQACRENLDILKGRRLRLDEDIELLTIRLATADGNNGDVG